MSQNSVFAGRARGQESADRGYLSEATGPLSGGHAVVRGRQQVVEAAEVTPHPAHDGLVRTSVAGHLLPSEKVGNIAGRVRTPGTTSLSEGSGVARPALQGPRYEFDACMRIWT